VRNGERMLMREKGAIDEQPREYVHY
jgi:hypothetical protein